MGHLKSKLLSVAILGLVIIPLISRPFMAGEIHEAAKKGDIEALKKILEANPGAINAAGEYARSPLLVALWANQIAAAKFLVESGADVNRADDDGMVPIGLVSSMGEAAVATLLIERGARINAQDKVLGASPLHIAAMRGRANMVRLLVDKGALLDLRTKESKTALALAVENGRRECAEILLTGGAVADTRDDKECTPLHRAVLSADLELVKLLLARKVDRTVRNAYGHTPLDLAVSQGLTEIAGLLSASGKIPPPAFPVLTGPYLGQTPPGRSPRMFAPGIVSTERNELNAVFTPDGKEFYFTIREATGRWTIMRMVLENGRWNKPQPATFSGRWSDVDLFITADSRHLYFCSDRPLKGQGDARKDFDIWRSERRAEGWSEPENLGEPVNSSSDEFYPSLTRDGTIYFQSRRPGGPGLADIWRARPVGGRWVQAECLTPPVNSAGFEGDTLVAADESYLILSAGRDEKSRQADLFLSMRRSDGTWGPLVKLSDEISSPQSGENCQMLSPDGRYLFFTRGGDIFWVDAAVIEKAKSGK